MPKRLAVALLAAAVSAVAGTAIAQTAQRFSDVPPDHEAVEAIEWAASVGLTVGYGDGTFGPDDPLSRWQAVVFMERYYDDVLQASESGDFTRGEMMVLLKAINDGVAPPQPAWTEEPEPESAALWLPRPEDRTADGRCAHLIDDTDFYDWEECAWGRHPDPLMGRDEMRTLASEVWAETLARGKPADPPALVEGQCRIAHAAACYIPATHTISIESGATRRSLLHELAHALIAGDATMADCYADWRARIPSCAHGALFRCAADALYVRYGDIDAAGVCGTPADRGRWTVTTGETIDGPWTEWRVDTPDLNDRHLWVAVGVQCTGSGHRAAAWFHYGLTLDGPPGGRFSPPGRAGVLKYRMVGGSLQQASTPGGNLGHGWLLVDPSEFLAAVSTADTAGADMFVQLVSIHWDDRVEIAAEAKVDVGGYNAHIAPRVASCIESTT